jgi:hypothetical protein
MTVRLMCAGTSIVGVGFRGSAPPAWARVEPSADGPAHGVWVGPEATSRRPARARCLVALTRGADVGRDGVGCYGVGCGWRCCP